MSNVDRRTVQRAEAGKPLQIETMSSIASALNVQLRDILDESNSTNEYDPTSKSLIVLHRAHSGMQLLNTVRDCFKGSITCEAEPTDQNIDVLESLVGTIESHLPDPWELPNTQRSTALSEQLRIAVKLGQQIKQLSEHDISVFAGTYAAKTRVPIYDPDEGRMYVHSKQSYVLVTLCRLIVAPYSRGERISINTEDIYDQWLIPPSEPDPNQEIPF